MKKGDYYVKVNIEEYINKQFGDVLILRENKTNTQTRVDYLCKCGYQGNIRLSDILVKERQGKKYRCRQCATKSTRKGTDLISGSYFYQIKHNAIKRNLIFDVTLKDLEDKWFEQNSKCAISGIELVLPFKKKVKEDGVVKTNYYGNASLDRIDSYKGYVKDNIQWVHSKVNTIKMELNQIDFIQLCKIIVTHNEKQGDINIDNCVIDKFKFANTKNTNPKNKLIQINGKNRTL